MRLTSSAFEHEGFIPRRYTCAGEDVSPPLSGADKAMVRAAMSGRVLAEASLMGHFRRP